jgi:DNA-binding MarR family transcriptional regulator
MKSLHNLQYSALERLFEVTGVLTDSMSQELNQLKLTPSRAEIIWRIGRQGPMTQRELSEALRCTPRNVTGLVDALEDLGLVAREPHPTDRRATLVTLTDRGTDAAQQWYAGYQQLSHHLFGDLDPTELTDVVATLDRILQRLRSHATNAVRKTTNSEHVA